MSSYRTSARADADLLELYLYGVENFGRVRAVEYVEGLHGCFELLGQNPRMGRKADVIAAGVRRIEHRSHVVLYEEDADGVLILAIVHGRSVRRLKL